MPVPVATQANANASVFAISAADSTMPIVVSLFGSVAPQPPGWADEPSPSLSFEIPREMVIRLSGQLTHGIVIRESLSIRIERDELGQLVAYEPRVNVYGVGTTAEEALDDLVSMLVDLVQELLDSEDILSSGLRQRLAFLRSILTLD